MTTNIWGLAGTVLTALLAGDAAFETYRAGSDERWWVVTVALVIAGLQFWLAVRRRALVAAWLGVAGLLLFPLGGLWFSSVADRGVVMLGIETRALAVIAVACGVIGAALAIALVPRMPRVAQVIIALLGLYAAAAFGAGLRQHAHLVDIVGGGSVWTRLPFWAQGGFIGAAVLLPVALLVVISRGLVALRRREGHHWSLQAVALVLCLLMVAPAFGLLPRGRGTPSLAAAPTALPFPDTTVDSTMSDLALLPTPESLPAGDPIQRLSESRQRLTALRYDRSARVAALAAGHEAAFQFVRDYVGFDAYQGILRGAVGTYLTRSGNAWDRALLLADLLQQKGVTRRYARGTLDGTTAERLYARLFERTRPADGDLTTDAGRSDNATLQRVRARAERDYRTVMAAHGNSLSVIGARAAREQALSELRDHVWVQAEVNGAWIDLDPSFTTAQVNERLTDVVETIDAPPQQAHQTVTVRVIAEVVEGTTPREQESLSTTINAVDLLGRRVLLAHRQEQGVGGAVNSLGGINAEFWTPILSIDGVATTGQPIRFGDGGTDLIAEWLEVITERPDGTRDVSRRALVDRGSAAARGAGRIDAARLLPLPRNDQGAIAPQALHAIWVTGGKHHLLDYLDAVEDLVKMSQDATAAPTQDDLLWMLGLTTFPIVAWSDHVAVPAADGDEGVRVYADAPRAIVVSIGVDSRDATRSRIEYDLLRDRVRALPRNGSAEKAAVDRRVWFGLLEGAIEHELAANAVVTTGGTAQDLVSTSALLGPPGVIVIASGNAAQLGAAANSDDIAARMSAALNRGAAVIVPATTGQPARGWWEVDADGTTKAVLASGLGGASYSPGSGGGRWLPGGRNVGVSTGGGSAIDPRLAADGRWHRARTLASPGDNQALTIFAELIPPVVTTTVALAASAITVLVINTAHAVASLAGGSVP
ncbi:MAG TPA: hypothetical protein VNJ02_18390 [Vicinamibacterales bacterium]|nr:hypothetical protein [Vicinamibacterales bacterium]